MADWDVVGERLKAGVAADVVAAQERARVASRVRGEVEQVRGVAEVDGVRVEVDSVGRLLSLELDPGVLGLGASGVAGLVLKTARRAHRVAVELVAGVAEREFGAESEFAARVRAEAESRLAPEPEQATDPVPERFSRAPFTIRGPGAR